MIEQTEVYKLVTEARLKRDSELGGLPVNGHEPLGWLLLVEAAVARAKGNWTRALKDRETAVINGLLDAAQEAVAGLEQHGQDLFRDYSLRRATHPAMASARAALLEDQFLESELKDTFNKVRSGMGTGEDWQKLVSLLCQLGIRV